MSDIKIGVVADERRQRQAFDLTKAVRADTVSYDPGLLGCTKNHIKVWAKVLQLGGDWAVVLEDDAVPVPDFRANLERALQDPPADVIGLYLGTNYPKEWQRFIKPAVASEANWIVASHLLHGVGTAIRMSLVKDMLRFVGNMSDEDKLWPVDAQITHWCCLRGMKVAYTNPSLVDHTDGESLIAIRSGEATRERPRHAHKFGALETYQRTSLVEIP